ncbi:MAG: hypothetical protein ACOX4F_00220 [Atopobiaceae bacterium]|jgi:hypothetical protein
MSKKRKIVALATLICVVVGTLIGVSTFARASSVDGKVNYSVKWADDSTLALTVSSNRSGVAHYVVVEDGGEAPTEDQVNAGEAVNITQSQDATATRAADSSKDQTVYVTFTDDENVSYGVAQLELPAKTSSTSSERVGTVEGKAVWNDGSTVTLSLRTEKAGTAYYLMKDATDAAPTADEVKSSGSQLSTSANTDATASITASSKAAKNIYI